MPHAWLFETLRAIEDYAIANHIVWLVPYLSVTNEAAEREMKRIRKLLPPVLSKSGRPSYLVLVDAQPSADDKR